MSKLIPLVPGRAPTPPAAGRPIRACMFTAESQRGHARYTRDLLTAMAAVRAVPGGGREVAVELVTSRDLAAPFRTGLYPTHAVLPPLTDRARFRNRLHWVAGRAGHYLSRERTFLRWLETRPDIDLLHTQEYTPWLAPWHFPRLRRRGLAVVSTVHNVTNHNHASRAYTRLSLRCWRSAWRACSALIVHTEGLRESLEEALGPGGPPVFVTPHAVWAERLSPPSPATPPGPGAPARLLFFGTIRPNKGLHVLLRAMTQMPDCRLTVAGEPECADYLGEVQSLADALPPGRVEWVTRFVDEREIAGLFDEAHLVVLPYTRFASQSGVLHQALAHGRPVVATAEGGLGESVAAWGVGEVVAPGSEADLAAGIRRALLPESYERAVEATARLRNELTWERMAEATRDVYRAVLA